MADFTHPTTLKDVPSKSSDSTNAVEFTPGIWYPIETVLKDGTVILVSFGTIGIWAVAWTEPAYADYLIWCVDDRKHGPYALRGYCDEGPTAPTHWQLLPPPPV